MGCNQSKAADDDYPPGNPPIQNSDRKSKALDVEDEKASVGCDENFPFIDEKAEQDKKDAEVGNGNADDFKPLPPLVLKEEKTESETMQVTKEREDNIEHERVVIQKQIKTVREEVHMVRIVDGEEICDTINEGTEEYRESGKEVLVIQEKLTKEELEEELRKMGQEANLDEEDVKEEKKEEEHSEPPQEEIVTHVTTTVVESAPVVSHEEKTEVTEEGETRTVITRTEEHHVEVVNGVQEEVNVESTTTVESTPPSEPEVSEDQVKVVVSEEPATDITNEAEVEVQGLPDPEPLEEDLPEQEESIKGYADDGLLKWDAKPSEPEIEYHVPGGRGEVVVVGSENVAVFESAPAVSEEIEVEAAPASVESVPEPEHQEEVVVEEPEPVKEEESEPVVEEESEPEPEPEPVVEDEPEPEPQLDTVVDDEPEEETIETVQVVEVESEPQQVVVEEEEVVEEEPKEEEVVEEPVQSDHEESDKSEHEASDKSDHEASDKSDHEASDNEKEVEVEESHSVEAVNSEEPIDKSIPGAEGIMQWDANPSQPEIVYKVPGGDGSVEIVGNGDESHVESNGVEDHDEVQTKTVEDVMKSAEEQEVSD